MRERIQKLLSSRGVGSRRKVEAWIEAGRLTVNGRPASAGQPISETDDVRLDGRRLRLARVTPATHRGIAYHRPAHEEARQDARSILPSSLERLPKPKGRRWIAVSPTSARDGGLELYVTDGRLAAALARRGSGVSSEFSIRIRGSLEPDEIASRVTGAHAAAHAPGAITNIESGGGEGTNRWLRITADGLRPRDLRRILEDCGLEVSRILRTRYGPVAMDRSLSRGRSRALTEGELETLHELAGIERDVRRAGSRAIRR